VASFITTDEQLQKNRGCCFLVQAMLPEGYPFQQFNVFFTSVGQSHACVSIPNMTPDWRHIKKPMHVNKNLTSIDVKTNHRLLLHSFVICTHVLLTRLCYIDWYLLHSQINLLLQ